MSDLKIGVILGSTRPGRNGKGVADWVIAHTADRPGATYELGDLADYPLPLLDEPSAGVHAAVHEGAHEAMGGQGRRVRRLHLRESRLQPLDLGSPQERLGLP